MNYKLKAYLNSVDVGIYRYLMRKGASSCLYTYGKICKYGYLIYRSLKNAVVVAGLGVHTVYKNVFWAHI